MDWFQIGPAYLISMQNSGYIMQNSGLNESQVGISIARRNINNLRYTDDITLMAESEEELKSLLMRMKEGSVFRMENTCIPVVDSC